ncbi:MAG: septum formation inhibitor Maf [Gammaproteobacteria bacterium]|nr:septum formation inhibitor Maf [Gammaproteobacteria bacterium]
MRPELVLASASPRRRELLSQMGVVFSVQPVDIDESRRGTETAAQMVQRLALEKASVVARQARDAVAVLAADTIVTQNDQVFGKPQGRQQAQAMWRQLAATKHQVLTAVALIYQDSELQRLVSTEVSFGPISTAQMARYWDTGEPGDKAGGYAIQGLASAWVTGIEGSYSNVVGLPLFEVNDLLRTVGHQWL